jgi:hypothetical protein
VGRGTGAGARLAVAGQGHRVGLPGPSTGPDMVPTRLTPPTVVRHCCEEILGRMRANLDELVAVLPIRCWRPPARPVAARLARPTGVLGPGSNGRTRTVDRPS